MERASEFRSTVAAWPKRSPKCRIVLCRHRILLHDSWVLVFRIARSTAVFFLSFFPSVLIPDSSMSELGMNVPLAGGVVAPQLIEGSISLKLLIAGCLLAAPRTKAAAEKSLKRSGTIDIDGYDSPASQRHVRGRRHACDDVGYCCGKQGLSRRIFQGGEELKTEGEDQTVAALDLDL